MKRVLILSSVLCLGLTSFSEFRQQPLAWDNPLHKVAVFTDPYVTNYNASVVGQFNQPNYAVNIQVSFDHSVPAPYYAVVQVFGLWNGDTSGSYKEFTLLFNTGQWFKSVNFSMHSYEVAYPTVIDLLDYGPQ